MIGFSVKAQENVVYYDGSGRVSFNPASIRYFSIKDKADTLYRKTYYYYPQKLMKMEGTFLDSANRVQHGRFASYFLNGRLQAIGVYEYNRKQGLWRRFYENGQLQDSAVYEKGNLVGFRKKWHPNGMVSDSIVPKTDGSSQVFSWFDNGHRSAEGRLNSEQMMDGPWAFFHDNGQTSALEIYENGKRLSCQYFDENGQTLTDTAAMEKQGGFGGRESWARYLQKNLDPMVPVKMGAPAGTYTVNIEFVIGRQGKVSEMNALTRNGYGMEEEAMRVIQKYKDWEPTLQHGRYVKTYHKQSVTFVVAPEKKLPAGKRK